MVETSYNNEQSGILIFCFEFLSRVCLIKKWSKRLVWRPFSWTR